MQQFSSSWKASKQPRKQRKYRANAPLHIKRKFMNARLTKELAKKYSRRSFPLRKGDTVKIVRGQFKGKTGNVERVDVKKSILYVAGIEVAKREGRKSFPPINPSNVMITELALEDKKRIAGIKKMTGQK
jgi:large subunit ribosomal protein L24